MGETVALPDFEDVTVVGLLRVLGTHELGHVVVRLCFCGSECERQEEIIRVRNGRIERRGKGGGTASREVRVLSSGAYVSTEVWIEHGQALSSMTNVLGKLRNEGRDPGLWYLSLHRLARVGRLKVGRLEWGASGARVWREHAVRK